MEWIRYHVFRRTDFEQVIQKSYNDEIECILYEFEEVKSKHRNRNNIM